MGQLQGKQEHIQRLQESLNKQRRGKGSGNQRHQIPDKHLEPEACKGGAMTAGQESTTDLRYKLKRYVEAAEQDLISIEHKMRGGPDMFDEDALVGFLRSLLA